MKSSLSQSELDQLIINKLHNVPIREELASRCALAESWDHPIGALTYLFARIIQAKNSESDNEVQQCIELFYSLPNTMFLQIQEIDFEFINQMVRNLRQPSNSLEDELLDIHARIIEHDFTKSIRY